MYIPYPSNEYKRSFRKYKKSGSFNEKALNVVINTLASGVALDRKYRDHGLKGDWEGFRECHVQPDMLLIYAIEKGKLILLLVDIGSHAELFG